MGGFWAASFWVRSASQYLLPPVPSSVCPVVSILSRIQEELLIFNLSASLLLRQE